MSSYVLALHDQQLVSRLALYNVAGTATGEGRLEIHLDSHAHAAVSVPLLQPGQRRQLTPPNFDFDLAATEALTERRWLRCRLRLNTDEIVDARLGVWMLPCNTFSFAPRHWPTLAAFVSPNHPLTARLAAAAPACDDEGAHAVLRALYTHLHDNWRITYRHEPPQFDIGAQRVRLPHDVLTDPNGGAGQASCLDLTLLLAGALEACGAQPLIAMLDLGSTYHALVGAWRRMGPRLDPIQTETDYVLSQAVWIDPNGCTRDAEQRCTVDEAERRAVQLLRVRSLLFALDVVAARHDGIVPLPFSGEPQWDPLTADVLVDAGRCSTEAGRAPSTVALLVALLRTRNGLLRDAFSECLGDADQIAERLAQRLGPPDPGAMASRNYQSILTAAKTGAKTEASPLVNEHHLISALLDARSDALDAAFKAVGICREDVRNALDHIAPGILRSQGDPSVFSPSS